MRILFLIIVSFFAFTDDHEGMYQPMYAEYYYCSQIVEDDDEAQEMFQAHVGARIGYASSFENDVSFSVLFPIFTNEEMRGGDDFFFVLHGPSRKALGEFNETMYFLMEADDNMPEAPFECKNNSEAFQRIGPSSDDTQYDEFAVDYWPCTYDEGADPEKLLELQATFAKEHYANGAKGGYRFIYPGAGGPRGQGPDFWISAGAPGLAARGENTDIFWEKSYGTAAERERWDHMSCDRPSTWYGYRLK